MINKHVSFIISIFERILVDLDSNAGHSIFYLIEYILIIYTRVRDKKRLVKVGNLVKNSYLYR